MFNYPVTQLRREMDRLFDDFWSTPQNEWQPACDVEESPDHYLLSIEMPGVSKDQIKLEVVDNQLTISGERFHDNKKKDGSVWYSERRFGKFHRSFTLPAALNSEKVEASYQDGILKIYLPKAESAKPRQIQIGTGSGLSFLDKLKGKTTLSDKSSEHVA